MAGRQAPFAATALVELQGTIHAIDPFVVPAVSRSADALVELAEAEFRVAMGERQQHIDDRLVVPRVWGITFYRAADLEHDTGPSFADLVFLPDEIHQLPFLVRPQSFFAMTSFKARFSSDTSA